MGRRKGNLTPKLTPSRSVTDCSRMGWVMPGAFANVSPWLTSVFELRSGAREVARLVALGKFQFLLLLLLLLNYPKRSHGAVTINERWR